MGEATVVTPWINLISSLGSAAGAVIVVYLFVQFISQAVTRQESSFTRLTMEFDSLAKDKGALIREIQVTIDRNTSALVRIEETVAKLSMRLAENTAREVVALAATTARQVLNDTVTAKTGPTS
jgi:hypothetical protein